jgi:hypothetical protein
MIPRESQKVEHDASVGERGKLWRLARYSARASGEGSRIVGKPASLSRSLTPVLAASARLFAHVLPRTKRWIGIVLNERQKKAVEMVSGFYLFLGFTRLLNRKANLLPKR